ncbi:hypothetical protein FR483_n393L [Paramecium bursaria Chlorella virus FR483]|uniref:Uncharacterized protein n393L n=1 Tax=Paramecium bursaria Chlorella virus FR483 TaxID=399781 RepID=A7J797_PBCVF|nr:hypothetical protein FR483_n393L [Paramecium bursaria Chlorella virus FR483]ABT15678.1 hypothetical protein FR483_n393L [Paramecium bursaria Chlorella virus FR483]
MIRKNILQFFTGPLESICSFAIATSTHVYRRSISLSKSSCCFSTRTIGVNIRAVKSILIHFLGIRILFTGLLGH